MFALADLIVMNAIEDGLKTLRENPTHLSYILGGFEQSEYMRNLHGSKYIQQCKDLILNNKIFVKPYYVLDLNKLPSISVIAQYSEELLSIGDFGYTEETAVIPALTVSKIVGVEWGSETNEIIVSVPNSEVLYSGLYLKQDEFITKVNLIIPSQQTEGQYTLVCADTLPKNRLTDWLLTESPTSKIAVVHGSGNTAAVSVELKSSGDIEVHRLLALVVRYCLKKGRYLMDANGLQISTSHQNFPALNDEEQAIFQTVFQLSGKIWDHWIEYEQVNQNYKNLKLCAVPSDVENDVVGCFTI